MKLSVRVNPERFEIEAVAEGGTHILKPEPNQYPELPQNENLCMNLASEVGLAVPPHGLFRMADENLCYIIKRFDRLEGGTKIHKETLFQILNAEDKYRGSLEQIGKAIHKHVRNVGLDSVEFFERVVFSFLIGNGDMHLKNWALLINDGGIAELAPCYDLVCSKMYIPDEDDSALSINGKRNKLKRSDFEVLASSLGIDTKAVERTLGKFYGAKDEFKELIASSELSIEKEGRLLDLINSRYERIWAN